MIPDLTPEAIAEKLYRFAHANLVAEGADFNEQSPLAEAGIDSFALVELLLFCERTFGISVPASHLTRKNLACVRALAECVAQLTGRAAANTQSPS